MKLFGIAISENPLMPLTSFVIVYERILASSTSMYLKSDCAQNVSRVANHVRDWPSIQQKDHTPVQIHRWSAVRYEYALQLALSSRQATTDHRDLP